MRSNCFCLLLAIPAGPERKKVASSVDPSIRGSVRAGLLSSGFQLLPASQRRRATPVSPPWLPAPLSLSLPLFLSSSQKYLALPARRAGDVIECYTPAVALLPLEHSHKQQASRRESRERVKKNSMESEGPIFISL